MPFRPYSGDYKVGDIVEFQYNNGAHNRNGDRGVVTAIRTPNGVQFDKFKDTWWNGTYWDTFTAKIYFTVVSSRDLPYKAFML
jgi:hypothetical protein